MATLNNKITLRKAALIAGLGYILMLGTPISEFLIFSKLVDFDNAGLTVKNITNHLSLFRYGVMLYLVNFIGDFIAAWALYILLKPVNDFLSLLAAWMRIIFAILSLVALMNLITALQFLQPHDYIKGFTAQQLQTQAIITLHLFREEWSFCYVFFGLYLILLGYLVFVAKYIPKIVGVCLMIAGLGWLIDSIQPYLFPNINISIGMIAGVGELVLWLWLLIKGTRLKEQI